MNASMRHYRKFYGEATTDDMTPPRAAGDMAVDDPSAAEDIPGGREADAPRATAITGKYNSSPVGDIKMTKVKGSYNTYKLEMSMGQLEVILTALKRNHADPVSDELLATFTYYIEKLPGPGEEEEEAEAAQKAGGGAMEDLPVPMPPGASAGGPPEGETELEPPTDEEMRGAKGGAKGGAKNAPAGAERGLPEPDLGEPAEPAEMELSEPPRE